MRCVRILPWDAEAMLYLGICLEDFNPSSLNTHAIWEANSNKFDEKSAYPVIAVFMSEIDKEMTGGSMKLGAHITAFTHNLNDG